MNEFNLINWQDSLVAKLLGISRKHGRKGNFAARIAENKAHAELVTVGYTARQADLIVQDVIDVASLERTIDRHNAFLAELAAVTAK
jgi:hypothetical protein